MFEGTGFKGIVCLRVLDFKGTTFVRVLNVQGYWISKGTVCLRVLYF